MFVIIILLFRYCSNEFPGKYPEQFKAVAGHMENYVNSNRLPVKENLSYYAKNWNWGNVEVRRNQEGQIMLIVPLNPFNLSTVIFLNVFIYLVTL